MTCPFVQSRESGLRPQQFPVKDLEVGGGAIRGDRRRQARQKGARPTVNSAPTASLREEPRRESGAFFCQGRPYRQTSPQTFIRQEREAWREQRNGGGAPAAPGGVGGGKRPSRPVPGAAGPQSGTGGFFLQIH